MLAEHMIAARLDPSALPTLPSIDAISFFRAHLYEAHDVWHVVTGFGTDIVGELGLQAFYLAQVQGPLTCLLIAVGFLRSALFDEALTVPLMEAIVRGWEAIVRGWRVGSAARPLFGVHWDERWTVSLGDVRQEFGIDVAGAQHGHVDERDVRPD